GELSWELFRLNIASLTQLVKDTEPPVITASNVTVDLPHGQQSRSVEYTPEASDSCSGLASVTCSPPSGSTFSTGTTPVTCTATDNSNNTAAVTFTVTVGDREPPAFVRAPPNISVPNDPGLCSAKVTYAPEAVDNSPGVTVACIPPSGSAFAKGVAIVECTATDTSGNTSAVRFIVAVIDTERPTVISAPDINVIAPPGTFGTNVDFAPLVTDNCPGMRVVLSPSSGSSFPLGTTEVTGIATDDSRNVTMFTFKVNVYNIVAVDDSTGSVFRAVWDGGSTAQYEYTDCRKGVVYAGTMSMTQGFCKIEGRDLGPDPKRPDRNVYILLNTCTFNASGWVQVGPTKYTFNDADFRNSRPTCP
ncbi:MAG TPA: HYR domain-containing protein, partial [Blastocatellia bacterium]|nr:HYR domain-containing protein [Blastocatellia bacterium]